MNCLNMIKRIYILFLCCALLLCAGCFKKDQAALSKDVVLVNVGRNVITKSDFEAAFEVSKIGYPHNLIINEHSELKEDVLTQLIEEQLVINEAHENNIFYSAEEFEKDLDSVKEEYPDNVFMELLEKNAIEYSVWEKRFKREKILEKSIDKLIKKNIEVTDEELKKGFGEYCTENSLNPQEVKDDPDISSIILEKVKRDKSEFDYDRMLEELKKKFEININNENWSEVLKSTKY